MKKISEDTKDAASVAIDSYYKDDEQYKDVVSYFSVITKIIAIISCLIDPMFTTPSWNPG